MKCALILAAALALGACGTDTSGALTLFEKAADTAGKVEDATVGAGGVSLTKYCMAPAFARKALRDRLNRHPKSMGNKAAVWCVGDDAITLGPDHP